MKTDVLASCRQIKAARALLGWTQRDLGHILGVDERQLRFWERRIPSNQLKIRRIIEAFARCGIEFIGAPSIGVRKVSDT